METTKDTRFLGMNVNVLNSGPSIEDILVSEELFDKFDGDPTVANEFLDKINGLGAAAIYLSSAEIQYYKRATVADYLSRPNEKAESEEASRIVRLDDYRKDRSKLNSVAKSSSKGRTPKTIKKPRGVRPSQIYLKSIK
ncbi:MAG TPA: hypothetical protein VMV24_00480 [Candidatus Dormibacteraeota bacterium]|nr:hypothetical protein [Candidatus Dormibacteraeota bacterium]